MANLREKFDKKALQIDLFNRKANPYLKSYKIYNDGSHYIAREKSYGRCNNGRRRIKTAVDYVFDILYNQGVEQDLAGDDLKEYILKGLQDDYAFDFPGMIDFVEKNYDRVQRNAWQREKRFRRKAFINPWNYFVTFTYDGSKHTEETFIKKLRKCLCNLHNRRGWKYMGVSERGEEHGRFHYHFLIYVPDGQMIGNLYTRKDYSTKRGTVKETISNDFFEKRFGRNDFEEVFMQANGKDAVKYCLKYMRKTNSRAIYGRGIPTEHERMLDIKYAAFCTLPTWKNGVIVDGIERHILFDSLAQILFGDYTNERMIS